MWWTRRALPETASVILFIRTTLLAADSREHLIASLSFHNLFFFCLFLFHFSFLMTSAPTSGVYFLDLCGFVVLSVSRLWSHILHCTMLISCLFILILFLYLFAHGSPISLFLPQKKMSEKMMTIKEEKKCHARQLSANSSKKSQVTLSINVNEKDPTGSDKSTLTCISLKIIWCHSLYLLPVKDSGGSNDFFFLDGKHEEKKWEKVVVCYAAISLSCPST